MSPIRVYFHHSVFYSIWVFLLVDGSVADRSTSCKQLSHSGTETTEYRDDGCFLLSRVPRTWEESKTFCENLGNGWSLVVIEDAETQKHVDSLTAALSSDSWIGLRRQDNRYKWVSGKSLGYPTFFRELGDGEVPSSGECVTTSPSEDRINYGTWNYAECTARQFTICHIYSGSTHQRTTTAKTSTTKSTPTSTTTSTTTSTPTLTTTPSKTHTTVKDKATPSTTQTTQTKAVATTTSSVKTNEEHAATAQTSSTRTTTSSVQTRPMTDSTPRNSTKPAPHGTCVPLIPVVIVALVLAFIMMAAVCLAWRCSAKRALLNGDAGQQIQGGDEELYLRPCPEEHQYAVVLE